MFQFVKQWEDCECSVDRMRWRMMRHAVSKIINAHTNRRYSPSILKTDSIHAQWLWYSLKILLQQPIVDRSYTAMNTRYGSYNIRCVENVPTHNHTNRAHVYIEWMSVMKCTAFEGARMRWLNRIDDCVPLVSLIRHTDEWIYVYMGAWHDMKHARIYQS